MDTDEVYMIVPNETKDTEETKPKPSTIELIKIIAIFYVILGIVCYYFNKEWFNYLYARPYNYLKSMTSGTK